MLLEIGIIACVILRVEKTLAHRSNDAHQRAGIGAILSLCFEGDMLKYIGPDNRLVGFLIREVDQGTGATNDSPGRGDQAGSKAQLTQGLQLLLVRRIGTDRTVFRSNSCNFVSRPGLVLITLLRWRAKKL